MQFDDFLKVLDLLKDPAKYEAQVKELEARNQAIQDSIAQLGVVGDVAKAKAKAEALANKAEALVASAQEQAAEIVANAQTAFDKRHAELKEREVVADQALADLRTIKSQTAARENELRAQEKQATALQEQLQKTRDELAAKQAEVDERLAKLRQVMG